MQATLGHLTDQTLSALDPILIAGPTASGKSALAVSLAELLHGTVINADSMQVYSDLCVVTARPTPADMARAPHRLYGTVPADQSYSTGAWLRDAERIMEAVQQEGRRPILVGGTGLYFKALTEGFAEMPEIDPAIRADCRKLAADGGPDAVRTALAKHDPSGADTLADLQRLTRALEVVLSTGRPISDWQTTATPRPLLPLARCVPLVLAPSRPWLHARIAARAELMTGPEGCREVDRLLARKLDPALPAMRAIGVKEIRDMIEGRASEEETHERITVATRQYAKRQDTWFRNQMPQWHRMHPETWTTEDPVLNLCIYTASQNE
ncbi:tRNA (adenosine(37)-N6)-dimethylallyltransferase MiaA [Roseibium aquae]|nr:tRNA (adenosine(37)-N6)-dimethylallyltransferase MiaA [Roseibium aquae]